MRCQNVQKNLFDLIDGCLPSEETDRLIRHVDQCPLCTAWLEGQKRLSALLTSVADWRSENLDFFGLQPHATHRGMGGGGATLAGKLLRILRPIPLTVSALLLSLFVLLWHPGRPYAGFRLENIQGSFREMRTQVISMSDDLSAVDTVVIKRSFDHTIALVEITVEFQ